MITLQLESKSISRDFCCALMSYLAFGEMIGLIVMSSIDVEKKNLNKIVFVNLKSLKTHYKYMFHELCCY